MPEPSAPDADTTPPRLDPRSLLGALSQGYFPMAESAESLELGWYRPDPRAILPLDDNFHVRRSLAKALRRLNFDIRLDVDFAAVMDTCAAPRDDAPGNQEEHGTWINPTIRDAYTQLATLGFGHSVEAFADGQRVGGLYGVALGGAFLAESMFCRVPYASQACLVALVEHLCDRGFTLLDVQFTNPHLKQFGVQEIASDEYLARLNQALQQAPEWKR